MPKVPTLDDDGGNDRRVVLAAVDGSPGSTAVASMGWNLAQRLGAVLRLVLVTEASRGADSDPVEISSATRQAGSNEVNSSEASEGSSGLAEIRRLAADLLERSGTAEQLELVLRHGKSAEEILAEADACKASVIVMGRRSKMGLAGVRLGSVSNKCTTQARRPVVVVNDFNDDMSGPIIAGIDGSTFSTTALNWAAALAAALSTKLVIVTAWQPPAMMQQSTGLSDEELTDFYGKEASEAVRSAAEQCRGEFPELEVDTEVTRGSAAQVLQQTAQERNASLIVVGSHGKTGFSAMLGSVARSCLRAANSPVAVVHPT